MSVSMVEYASDCDDHIHNHSPSLCGFQLGGHHVPLKACGSNLDVRHRWFQTNPGLQLLVPGAGVYMDQK